MLVTGNLPSCRAHYQPLLAPEVNPEESSDAARRFDEYLADLERPGTWGDRTCLVRAKCGSTMCSQAMLLAGEDWQHWAAQQLSHGWGPNC